MRTWNVALTVMIGAMLAAPTYVEAAGWRGGVGVLGDSYSDEYEFYPPHRIKARNWVEILAKARGIDFGSYSSDSRGEPRNRGYAYNWARSDAETTDMIATGQHLGLAQQVASGEVWALVVVFIGGNDFIHALQSSNPASAIEIAGPRAVRNLKLGVETLLKAHPEVKLLLATVPDIRDLPEFRDSLADRRLSHSLVNTASAAIQAYNLEIRALARDERRICVLDVAVQTRVVGRLFPMYVPVAGQKIERIHPSDEPDHLFLNDARHLGTVGQGIFARMILDALNARFEAGITPLSDREIMDIAVKHASLAARGDSMILAADHDPMVHEEGVAVRAASGRKSAKEGHEISEIGMPMQKVDQQRD